MEKASKLKLFLKYLAGCAPRIASGLRFRGQRC